MGALQGIGPLVGRILMAAIFVLSGFNKFTGLAGTAAYIASKGLPLPQLLAIGAAILEVGAGTLLLVGWKARWAAAALFLFTAIAALFFHNFWAVPPEQAQNQMIHFMKNLAMMGGLLYIVTYGSGPLSLEGKGRRRPGR